MRTIEFPDEVTAQFEYELIDYLTEYFKTHKSRLSSLFTVEFKDWVYGMFSLNANPNIMERLISVIKQRLDKSPSMYGELQEKITTLTRLNKEHAQSMIFWEDMSRKRGMRITELENQVSAMQKTINFLKVTIYDHEHPESKER